MTVADLVTGVFGDDLPIGLEAYDGSHAGPSDPPATLVVRSPDAVRRLVTAPGDLGFGRAYVAGDLDIEGDLFAALELRNRFSGFHLSREQWLNALRLATASGLHRPPLPPEEAHLHGRRHSPARDAAAIAHHYDVSNDFYRIVLGPSMTYSCGVWSSPDVGLEAAQAAKYELICQKLALQPGMRLLDVGCGWGSMVMHAAQHHGVRAVGVTVSRRQQELAAKRVAEAGLSDQVEIRLQDYRDVTDGPFDAISSIGMFEHVGLSKLELYFDRLMELLVPEGRLLNHAISRPAAARGKTKSRFKKQSFIDKYVFPDGELHEVGAVVERDATTRLRGPSRREPAGALRIDAAGMGPQPRGRLGPRGLDRRGRSGAGLASVHGCVRDHVRGRKQPDPPGARREAERRSERHAAAPLVQRTPGPQRDRDRPLTAAPPRRLSDSRSLRPGIGRTEFSSLRAMSSPDHDGRYSLLL